MATYGLYILECMQLRAETTVDTEELLVHDRRQRQSAERFNARLIDPLAILVLALQLESKVVRQVTALVVTAQKPERVGIPDLQCPQVQNALRKVSEAHTISQQRSRRNKPQC